MRRYHLRRKKVKEIKNKLALPVWVDGTYEVVEDEFQVVLVNGIPAYFFYDGLYFPTVHILLRNPLDIRYVTVDMGAVKYVLNGANVFAPGIVDADESIKRDNAVYVRDEKYGKPLAVGISLMDGKTMIREKKGVAVKNIHHYGDKIWSILN